MINAARIRVGSASRALGRASIYSSSSIIMSDLPSEDFRNAPNDSATFGNVPQDTESFRTIQNTSERKPNHRLTVREVARMFETAGVARTERSITNWCQPNKTGIARLDAYFDPNERKYFISSESVGIAIQEEQSKEKTKDGVNAASRMKAPEEIPNASATGEEYTGNEMVRLRREMVDLQIANRVKDMFIERLQKDREHFDEEREDYVEKLMMFNRRVGQLETRLGIEAPTLKLESLDQSDSFDAAAAA